MWCVHVLSSCLELLPWIVWSRYNDFLAASLISSQDRVVLHDGILKVR